MFRTENAEVRRAYGTANDLRLFIKPKTEVNAYPKLSCQVTSVPPPTLSDGLGIFSSIIGVKVSTLSLLRTEMISVSGALL